MRYLLLTLTLILTSCGSTLDLVTGEPIEPRPVINRAYGFGYYQGFYNPYLHGYNPYFLGPRIIVVSSSPRPSGTSTVRRNAPAPSRGNTSPAPRPASGGRTNAQ